jgi:hypothetical protein
MFTFESIARHVRDILALDQASVGLLQHFNKLLIHSIQDPAIREVVGRNAISMRYNARSNLSTERSVFLEYFLVPEHGTARITTNQLLFHALVGIDVFVQCTYQWADVFAPLRAPLEYHHGHYNETWGVEFHKHRVYGAMHDIAQLTFDTAFDASTSEQRVRAIVKAVADKEIAAIDELDFKHRFSDYARASVFPAAIISSVFPAPAAAPNPKRVKGTPPVPARPAVAGGAAVPAPRPAKQPAPPAEKHTLCCKDLAHHYGYVSPTEGTPAPACSIGHVLNPKTGEHRMHLDQRAALYPSGYSLASAKYQVSKVLSKDPTQVEFLTAKMSHDSTNFRRK